MKRSRKIAIFCAALLVMGAIRMPLEIALTRELRSANLLPPELNIGTRERIGQTSSAVALGGLRTLVATFLNLKAYNYFMDMRWDDLGETFNTIVDLAPRTGYYWDVGSWHLAYNAASYYIESDNLPPVMRKNEWRNNILKGRAFLERGIRNNPNDWKLKSRLGQMLADSNKIGAFPDEAEAYATSAAAYKAASEIEHSPLFMRRAELYSLARVPGREAEALSLAKDLNEHTKVHPPTLRCLLFVLQMHENPKRDARELAVQIFKDPKTAYQMLSVHWQRTDDRFPQDGVASALVALEAELQIPEEKSVFNIPQPRRMGPKDWFQK
ncbi:hypothetical protein JIN85_11365 [Luteolibacter pohnpeiensis]|uniref:Uncharacterized protein n=1 Tax=Luteolibacter pohnpeiensis TaxID=454153 RepID=A0A934SBA2_9BACT|nr:hypothetical protein [Luteolibacter pohnpeiensis]MBK1883017.1 hypothetical protein [Luteolibacter pohnpeiensis]